MHDPLTHLGLLEERAAGVFQYTLSYETQSLSLETFASCGLSLPETLQGAVLKRQLDFLAGRYCVKKLYETYSLKGLPLPETAVDRSPIWPSGWIGSISHTKAWAAAIMAPDPPHTELGLDLEYLIDGRSPGLFQQICREDGEWQQLSLALECSPLQALTLIFSAKESFFKALYPKVRSYFGFHAARVYLLDYNSLGIELLQDLPPYQSGMIRTLKFRARQTDIWETLLLAAHPI